MESIKKKVIPYVKSNIEFDYFDRFYFFYLFIFCASAIPITKDPFNLSFPLILLITSILTIVIIFKHKVNFFNQSFITLILFFLVWVFYQIISQNLIQLGLFLIFLKIILSYVVVKVFKIKLIEYYIKLMYFFSITSIIFWLIYIVNPSLVTNFVESTALYESNTGSITSSNLIYSISNEVRADKLIYDIFRNSGISWEPGRFSIMITIAVALNFMTNGNKFDKRVLVFILAIITTFSTTGYLTLFVIIFIHLINNKSVILKVSSIVFFSLGVFIFINLNFLSTKILSQNIEQEMEDLIYKTEYSSSDELIIPQRLTSFYFEYLNMVESPFFGYGLIKNSFIHKNLSEKIHTASGLIIFSKYGIFISILIIYFIYKSSILFSRNTSYNGFKPLFFIAFILCSSSYHLFETTLFMSFCLYWVFEDDIKIPV